MFRSLGLREAVVGAFLLAGCGDGDAPKAREGDAAPPTTGEFAIRGYHEVNGKLHRVAYSAGFNKVTASLAKTTTKSIEAPGLQPESYQKCQGLTCGGSSFLDVPIESDGDGQAFSGDQLLQDIGETCLLPPDIEGARKYDPLPSMVTAWEGDDTSTRWYIFAQRAQSCDAALQQQEVLLCVADRLATIADAVNTVRFESRTTALVFPPQELKDKFIVRDLALNALAHVALLDQELPTNRQYVFNTDLATASCSEAYGQVYNDPALVWVNGQTELQQSYKYVFSDDHNDHIFSDHLFHGDPDDLRDDVLFRAKLKGHILGAAATLLRDVIDKSVQADLAGAETRRGQAGDARQALERMWGVEDESVGPYDSLRHALHVLFGRLEAADLKPGDVPFEEPFEPVLPPLYRAKWDPKCGGQSGTSGVRSLDLIYGLGSGFPARWHDIEPTSGQQSLAMSTLGQMGMVLPPSALSDMSAARMAFRKQLYLHNAAIQGVPVANLDSASKQLYDTIVDGIEDAALRFGLERSYDAYRLLTNSPADLTALPATAPGGLTFAGSSEVAAEVTALHGAVVLGGLQRRDILTDPMGTLGAAQAASECPSTGSAVDGEITYRAAAYATFQDSFLLGATFATRSGFLRDSLAAAGLMPGDESRVLESLDGSITSIRSWAAKAIVQHSYDSGSHPLHIRINGLTPDDLGVSSVDEMKSKIVIVWGEPWQAECAAGIRSRCSPKSTWGIINPSASFATAFSGTEAGLRGTSLLFSFSNSAHASSLQSLGSKRYYVVTPTDAKGGQAGRILAAVAPAAQFTERVSGISDYQRSLANSVFGTNNQNQQGRRTCSNATTSGLPHDYCIAGMQRDMFVPLSNELTSDGGTGEESWRHYVTIAEQAAARADDLGRQMIEKGEQREIRREGGQEQLGTLCGTYVPVDSLHADANGVAGSDLDDRINQCTKPATIDVVFLTDDPYDQFVNADNTPGTDADVDTAIRKEYCDNKSANERPGFCEKDHDHKEYITHAGLGLATYAASPPNTQCDTIVSAAQKLSDDSGSQSFVEGLALLAAAAKEAWVTPEMIGAGLGPLHYEVGQRGGDGTVVMTSGVLHKYHWWTTRNDKPWMVPTETLPSFTGLNLKDKASVFPACLGMDIGPLKAESPPLCSDDPKAQTFDIPDCTSPCLGDARKLAQAFGTSNDDDGYMHDLEAALWYAGALAGRIPDGLFKVRVPVRNENAVEGDVQAAELYAAGRFISNGGSSTYRLYSDNSGALETALAESTAMGAVFNPLQAYWSARVFDENGRGFASPGWRSSIYADALANSAQGKHLLTLPVGNTSITFDEGIPSYDENGGVISRELVATWVASFVDKLGGSSGCTDNGSELLAPLNVNVGQQTPDLNKDLAYATIKNARNICNANGVPVFFEDPAQKTLHARLYYRSEDEKEEDVESPIFRAGDPYLGWSALGDLVDTKGLTSINVVEHIGNDDLDPPHTSLFLNPYDPSTLKGGVFSLASFSEEETKHYGFNTTSPSIQNECHTNALDPSAIPLSCLLLGGAGVTGIGTKMGTAVSVTGENSIGSDQYRVEYLTTRGILAGRRLRPTVCRPGDRAELFINRYPKTSCDAAQAVARGLAVACLGSSQARFEMSDIPPRVQSPNDLRLYDAWANSVERTLSVVLNRMAFKNLPKAVVDRFRNRDFTSELAAGQYGTTLYALANNLEGLHRSWHTVGSGFSALHTAVATARLQLESVDLKARDRELQIAQQTLELSRQAAMAEVDQVASLMRVGASLLPSSCSYSLTDCSFSPSGVAMAAIDAYSANRRQSITDDAVAGSEKLLSQVSANGMKEDMNAKSEVLSSFQDSAQHALDSVDEGIGGVRVSGNDILSSVSSIQQVAAQAQFQLGKVMGSDFVTEGDTAIPQHVNTVLNREFNILHIRYEKALDEAKRAAYLARLAIEQKLGVRFADLNESVGPLPPPSGWIEDLCSLQGIDYSKLRCVGSVDPDTGTCLQFGTDDAAATQPATLNDSSSPQIQNFANQYIGDYVARLKELVEFYNVAFPFKEADDVAVLSLRDNLLAPDVACHAESPNLLCHSDDLSVSGLVTDRLASLNGWRSHRCDAAGCVSSRNGAALKNPDPASPTADLTQPNTGIPVSPPDNYGAVSWLAFTAGAANAPASDDHSPVGSVYQSLSLKKARSYLASWWDMARKADGTPWDYPSPNGGVLPSYEVAIYNADWVRVGTTLIKATNPGAAGTTWSDRNSFEFLCPEDGVYHLVFRPLDTSQDMSLSIANVQLEELSKSISGFTAYVHTEAQHEVDNPACAAVSQRELLAGFTRRCEGGGSSGKAASCFYELNRNIVIDAESHNNGFGGLVGQVSIGNSNLRHVDLGLNLVGTGVLDCSNSNASSCYSSAFVEYDLEHSAFNAAVQNQRGQTTCFNFGAAGVRGGKALAAERVITLPLSSADRELLENPAFTKTELAGRPISGVYRLRIKDSPALAFDKIEDVQLVLHYRYWSSIAPTSGH